MVNEFGISPELFRNTNYNKRSYRVTKEDLLEWFRTWNAETSVNYKKLQKREIKSH